MKSDGKRLENLVAFVEQALLPAGFKVATNDRVYNDDGVQIAEFDVHAIGKIGTTEFRWLIECRDRPATGPAPVSWIEQLVGRRERFKFNKVTAVSTTGFGIGAADFATAQGIELREVASLSAEAFAEWLYLSYMTQHVRHTTLLGVYFLLSPQATQDHHETLAELSAKLDGDSRILRSTSTGELCSLAFAFIVAASSNEDLFDGLVPNGEAKRVRLHATYSEEDHFIVDAERGAVNILGIVFEVELRLKENQIPIVYTGEYRGATDGEPISQLVSFAPLSIMGMEFCVEMHRFAQTGETDVVLRRLAGSPIFEEIPFLQVTGEVLAKKTG